MKILALSDEEDSLVYSPRIRERYSEVDLIISCGDLPLDYLEYVISMLDKPAYFVLGNHVHHIYGKDGERRTFPEGAQNLHVQCRRSPQGLLLAGIEGSLRYNPGHYQYTQSEMWMHVLRLVPGLMLNRLRFGRYLDVFVTHAPSWGIQDRQDLPHHGIRAFRWLLHVFKPKIHIHGHVHLYRRDEPYRTCFEATQVINAFGCRVLDVNLP
ncbi:MAG TPA: metallophosphoesterase [Anaerolineaceae bacterium]